MFGGLLNRASTFGLLVYLLSLTLVVAHAGCERFGSTIDIDGRRPVKLEGTWRISWAIERATSAAVVSCGEVGALHVLTIVEGARLLRTYRARCDIPAREAWIPIERGKHTVWAKLVNANGEILSQTSEQTLEVHASTDELATPLLFTVR